VKFKVLWGLQCLLLQAGLERRLELITKDSEQLKAQTAQSQQRLEVRNVGAQAPQNCWLSCLFHSWMLVHFQKRRRKIRKCIALSLVVPNCLAGG